MTVALLLLVLGAFMVAPMPAAAAAPTPSLQVPVSGSNSSGSFVGTAKIANFAVQNGNIVAVGTLVGTLTNTATGAVSSIVTNFTAPLAINQASCQILSLTIGPINLDLLGLVIQTNTITLNITALPGAGNLLGNLLCDVANLLNNPSALVSQLNNLLAALGL